MRWLMFCVSTIMFFVCLFSGFSAAQDSNILENYGKIPLSFTENNGKLDSRVKFTTRGNGATMFFTPEGTTFLMSRETEGSKERYSSLENAAPGDMETEIKREYEYFSLKLNFTGANPDPEVLGEDRLAWNNNYFSGSDPAEWRTDVPNYSKVRLNNLYDGIDLIYYGNQDNIKYDFVVKPGADPRRILLTYDLGEYAESGSLRINSSGELIVSTPFGEIIEREPYCYQIIGSKEIAVEAKYEITDIDNNRYTFSVSDYDGNFPLIIDPAIVYSSYLGTYLEDRIYGLTADSDGNAYITGITKSSSFPTTSGAYDETYNLSGDNVFVSKISASGNSLLYSTFISQGVGMAIAVNGSGQAYVTGYTVNSNFPTTTGVFAQTYGGGAYDTFVSKLNSDGSDLIFSTFLGGDAKDVPEAIVLDDSSNIYITGKTRSSDFPALSPYDSTYSAGWDVYLTKLNPDATGLLFSTYFGSSGDDFPRGLKVDGTGNAFVTGAADSANFPITQGAYDSTFSSSSDIFSAKFTAQGNLSYSTFIGGNGIDIGYDIDVDASGNAYIIGTTSSTDYPVTPGVIDNSINGSYDIIISKLNASGTDLLASTFLGGCTYDTHADIVLDSNGDVFVTGFTNSTGFPTTADAFDRSYNGGYTDIFLSKLNSNLTTLQYSTIIGGNGDDGARNIATGDSGYVFVSGFSTSDNFPTSPGTIDISRNNGYDAVIVKIDMEETVPNYDPILFAISDTTMNEQQLLYLIVDAFDKDDADLYLSLTTAPIGMTFDSVSGVLEFIPGYDQAGTYTVTVKVEDGNGGEDTESFVLTVNDVSLPPVITVSPTALNFDSVLVGSLDSLKIAVGNSGDTILVIDSLSTLIPQFSVIPDSFSVESGGTDTIKVTFTPDTEGNFSDSLKLYNNDTLKIIYIHGAGYTVSPPVINVSPTTLEFGLIKTGSDKSLDISVSNSGETTLVVDSILVIEPFSTSSSGFSVAPGDSETVTVVFTPVTVGTFTDSLILFYGDSTFIVNISGSAYDQPVFDPSLLFSTYLGGNDSDLGYDIAVDASGYIYVTGETRSENFPTTPGAFDETINGNETNIFVSKFDPTGTTLIFSTFIGIGLEPSIVVDSEGNSYITGQTYSTDFPTTAGAYDEGPYNDNIGFITKLNSSGNGLLYSTYIGIANTYVKGIAVDNEDNAYITGSTNNGYPTTSGAFDETYNLPYGYDGFVSKLNSSGSALVYSTYLGGETGSFNKSSTCNGIVVDDNGFAYITGITTTTDFPTTPGSFDREKTNNIDEVFVTKLDSSGSSLIYSTYIGDGFSEGIAIDDNGCAYITGSTLNNDFPTTPGAFAETTNDFDGEDGFVTKLNPDGSGLLFSTFLGGSDDDKGNSVTVDDYNKVYITGYTRSGSAIEAERFPTTTGDSVTYNGDKTFVSKFNTSGSELIYSTVIPGSVTNIGEGIALDNNDNIYITGYVTGDTAFADSLAIDSIYTNYPTTSGAFSESYNGGTYDAFISKLGVPAGNYPPVITSISDINVDENTLFTLQVNATDADGDSIIYSLTESPDSMNISGSGLITWQTDFSSSGIYTVTVKAEDINNDYDTESFTLTVNDVDSSPVITVSSTILEFDSVQVGETDSLFITVGNAGGDSLVVDSLKTSAPFGADSTGFTIASGDSNTVTVYFSPTSSGTFSDSLTIFHSDTIYSVVLTGTGYDNAFPPVTDPLFLYSSYLGGSDTERAGKMTVDPNGYIYITGKTASSDFATTAGVYSNSFDNSGENIFVRKYDPTGTQLLYSTFIGLGGTIGITADDEGNVYITGTSGDPDYPTTPGAYDRDYNGSTGDIFVTKLNSDGSDLIFSTFIGGSEFEQGRCIILDDEGNVYISGVTRSDNFPVTVGVFDGSYNGGDDIIFAKLNSTGSDLIYSTFLGGSDDDTVFSMAQDDSGYVYITGHTASGGFPTTTGAYSETFSGSNDVFVTKLDLSGSSLVYSTLIGGTDNETGVSVNPDNSGNVIISGITNSTDFPTTPGVYDSDPDSDYDVFALKLNSAGDDLVFSTFFGGSSIDISYKSTVDEYGNIYIAGFTGSTDFPTTSGAFNESFSGGDGYSWAIYNGNYDCFISRLSSDGSSLSYSSYIGGSGNDFNEGLVIDNSGKIIISGWTTSPDFPTTSDAIQRINNGVSDVYFSKLSMPDINMPPVLAEIGDRSVSIEDTLTITLSAYDADGDSLSYSMSDSLSGATLEGSVFTWIPAEGQEGTHQTTFTVTDGENSDSETITITVNPFGPVITTSPTTLDFNRVQVGETDSLYLTIINTGEYSLSVDSLKVNAPFETDSTGFTVTTGDSNTVAVYFSPASSGTFNESLTIFHSDTLYTVGLTGTGVVPSPPVTDPLFLYSSYLGGSDTDLKSEMTVDPDGYIYIAGITSSSDFAVTAGSYKSSFDNSGENIFVRKFDPTGTQLLYSTFIGIGQLTEIRVDNGGNLYLTGVTGDSDYPTTPGAYDRDYNGLNGDIFVTKLNSSGSDLVYSTFIGGSDYDRGYCILLDDEGNVYVAGTTRSDNFPVTAGVFDGSYHGEYDIIVAKLNSTGSDLIYSTFLGGSDRDIVYSMAADDSGYVYITGRTQSEEFPTTSGAYSETFSGDNDVFVTKLDPSGSSLVYSTLIGGTDYEKGFAVNPDNSGNVILTGITNSSDFPTTPGVYDSTPDADYDIFALKLNSAGDDIIFSTFFGGSSFDISHKSAVDANGNIYMAGFTESTDLPTTSGAFSESFSGGDGYASGSYNSDYDSFISKLSSNGASLLYSSYIGGSGNEFNENLFMDSTGTLLISGWTTSSDFPTTSDAIQRINEGINDIYFSKLSLPDVNISPVLAEIGDRSLSVGDTLTIILSAYDANGDSLSYSMSDSVSGATLEGSVFTWIPAEGQAGTHQTTFTVTDGEYSDDETITITVISPAPVITVSPTFLLFDSVLAGETDSLYLTIGNTGDDSLVVDSLKTNAPFHADSTGFSVASGDSSTVIVTFTPTGTGLFNDTLSIFHSDTLFRIGLTGTGYIPVETAPVITVNPDSLFFDSVLVGDSDSLKIAVGNIGDAVLVIDSVTTLVSPFMAAPENLSIQPEETDTIKVTFAPQTAGYFAAWLKLYNNDTLKTVYIKGTGYVQETGSPLEIITTSLQNAVEDEAYTDTVWVNNSTESDSCVFEILEGPDWLILTSEDSLSILSGTPGNEDVGIEIQVSIMAAVPEVAYDTLSTFIDVINVNDAPVIITELLDSARVCSPYSDSVFVSDIDAADSLFYTVLNAPEWITAVSHDSFMVLSGIPASADTGYNEISIRISDIGGLSDTLSTTIFVDHYLYHYTYRKKTGESYSIIVDTIHNILIELGDEIAVLDGELVVGASVFDGNFPLGMTAWKDDSQTQEVDGYIDGSEMVFKVYDTSAEIELAATAFLLEGNGEFGDGAYARLSLAIGETVTQAISLDQGWNIISSYIYPLNIDLDSVFSGISDSLAIAQNNQGKFYIPDVFDNIQNWDTEEAFKLFMYNSATLDMTGSVIPLSTEIHLNKGWNLVPNYNTGIVDIAAALESLGDELIIVQNDEGQFYIPGVYDNIGTLIPGEGYAMYVSKTVKFSYPLSSGINVSAQIADNGSGKKMLKGSQKETASEANPFYSFTDNTGGSYSIVIQDAVIEGNSLTANDEIGVFDITASGDTLCIGAAVLTGSYPAGLTAWADDSQTDAQDGYINGHNIIYRMYDSSEKTQYYAAAEYSTGDGTFGNGPYSIVTGLVSTEVIIPPDTVFVTSDPDSCDEITIQSDSGAVAINYSNGSSLSLQFNNGDVSNQTISVQQISNIAQNAPNVPEFNNAMVYYDIELDVQDFEAQLTFGYDDNMILSSGINEDSLAVTYFDSSRAEWVVVPSQCNKQNNRITVTTGHFSLWAITSKEEELITSATEEKISLPESYRLFQNYPNPFNPVTTIRYQIPQAAYVTIKIYSVTGELVRTIMSGEIPAGIHEVMWDGTNNYGTKVSSGMYIYHMQAGAFSSVKKMLFLK